MTWADILVAVCALLYIGTAIAFLLQGKYAWGLVYASYACANWGLILAARTP